MTMQVDTAVQLAADAAREYAELPLSARSSYLLALAEALDEHEDELVALAAEETGLTVARLRGELARTSFQLRLFARVVDDGGLGEQRLEPADPDFVLGPRPELRRLLLPIGPVAMFAASNFPFAFSVLGGDTASALAAGCPVIVKAHPGHPRLSERTFALASDYLATAGAPHGILTLVSGEAEGVQLLQHPAVRAASFTGSVRGGVFLAEIAARRPRPIPFFGELGSVNPVFVGPDAAERPEVAAGYAASVGGSAGQLCTKPGFLFAPRDSSLGAAAAAELRDVPEHRMLYPGLGQGYAARRADILGAEGVRVLREGTVREADGHLWVTPTLVSVTVDVLRSAREVLLDEAFGPLSIVVEYDDPRSLPALAEEFFEGSLTTTLWTSDAESSAAWIPDLHRALLERSGRVIRNGWPTGVAVSPAQQHGGPWPSTTDSQTTSVGTAAVFRFLRPVTFQNLPLEQLPAEALVVTE